MTDREGGFILLHRRVKDWPLWKAMTAEQRMVFVELLLMANWKPSEVWVGATRIQVGRGEVFASELAIANHASVGRQVVRDTLRKLFSEGALTQRDANPEANQDRTRPLRILTLVNYERYQAPFSEENHQPTQSGTKREPIENQSPTPSERRGKKGKEEKPSDGRFAPVTARLVAVFEEVRRTPYGHQGAKDAQALKRILSYPGATDAEIESRWRTGLASSGYHRCDTIAELAMKWNAYVNAPPRKTINPNLPQIKVYT